MKTSSKTKRALRWVSRRSGLFVIVLFFAVVTLSFWFLFAGFSPNAERTIIGIAAITAFLSAISAIATLLQAVEVQKQRERVERPYIIAYFDGASNGAIYFMIENSGNSPASDVSFTFVPPPVDFSGRLLNEVSLFSNPISFLPTGQVIRQIIDAGHNFLENGRPTKFRVTVKYFSIFGDRFTETIDHDLEYLREVTLPRKTTEDHLEVIGKEISELTSLIKKAQGLNSFLVETPDEYSSRMKPLRNEHVEPNSANKVLQKILVWLVSKLNRG